MHLQKTSVECKKALNLKKKMFKSRELIFIVFLKNTILDFPKIGKI